MMHSEMHSSYINRCFVSSLLLYPLFRNAVLTDQHPVLKLFYNEMIEQLVFTVFGVAGKAVYLFTNFIVLIVHRTLAFLEILCIDDTKKKGCSRWKMGLVLGESCNIDCMWQFCGVPQELLCVKSESPISPLCAIGSASLSFPSQEIFQENSLA